MTDFTQTDNTGTGGKSVAGGTTVTNTRRSASYTTNAIINGVRSDTVRPSKPNYRKRNCTCVLYASNKTTNLHVAHINHR